MKVESSDWMRQRFSTRCLDSHPLLPKTKFKVGPSEETSSSVLVSPRMVSTQACAAMRGEGRGWGGGWGGFYVLHFQVLRAILGASLIWVILGRFLP